MEDGMKRCLTLSGLLVVLALGACTAEQPVDDLQTSEVEQASPSPSPSPEATIAAAPVSRCRPFPESMAEDLITNQDTGKRKIEGPILKTASVKSDEQTSNGRAIWFISINVDGTLVTLAHDTAPTDSAEGSGLYAAVDEVSERATGFPPNDRLKSSLSTDGAQESRDCAQG